MERGEALLPDEPSCPEQNLIDKSYYLPWETPA